MDLHETPPEKNTLRNRHTKMTKKEIQNEKRKRKIKTECTNKY